MASECKSKYSEDYLNALRGLIGAFQLNLRDLRLQIVKEVCLTICFLSQSFEKKCETFFDFLITDLMNLIQSNKAVIASSGYWAIRFIIKVSLKIQIFLDSTSFYFQMIKQS